MRDGDHDPRRDALPDGLPRILAISDSGALPITIRPPGATMPGRYARSIPDACDAMVERKLRLMKLAYDAHDYERALDFADRILSVAPGHNQAMACAAACSSTLERDYVAKLGGVGAVLAIAVENLPPGGLMQNARTSFVVPLLDGEVSLGELLDQCGNSRLEALRALVDLSEQGLVRTL